jgi:hypothetical protein
MDPKVFFSHCLSLTDRLQDNIDTLTQRYVDSSDAPDAYTESIAPILEQQIKILELLRGFVKP